MNPNLNPVSNGQQTGSAAGNPLNDPSVQLHQGYSSFPRPHHLFLSLRFGEITPFFMDNGVEGDNMRLGTSHELRTYTLQAPLMSKVRFHKDFFSVPMECIMPHTWEKLLMDKKRGNDVPLNAYPTFKLEELVYNLVTSMSNPTFKSPELFLYGIILSNYLLSAGSILKYCGCSLFKTYDIIEARLNDILSKLGNYGITVTFEDLSTLSWTEPTSSGEYDLFEWRDFFYKVSQYPDAIKTVVFSDFEGLKGVVCKLFQVMNIGFAQNPKPYDLTRLIAYQMVCSQFFTKDNVDNIYDSETYHNTMLGLYRRYLVLANKQQPSFLLNGVPFDYDVFSELCTTDLVMALSNMEALDYSLDTTGAAMFFMINLFGYNRALKYGDYFTGCRTRVIGIGDTDIEVVNEKVKAIDVTKSLIYQRYFNAVNRVKMVFSDYAKKILGQAPVQQKPRPRYIGQTISYVGHQEVENTSEKQGAVTTNLRDTGKSKMYSFQFDDRCILVGVMYVDCLGAYTAATERFFFHKDRYDWFQPWLQDIGDQDVRASETAGAYGVAATAAPFGYQLQDAEYKFKYSAAHGAFALRNQLPGWAFLYKDVPAHINSDFIRHRCTDFDRFYSQLTGLSLGYYFHFAVAVDVYYDSNRRMTAAPKLGV